MGKARPIQAAKRGGFWRNLLWSVLFPVRDKRVVVTAPGALLIALAIAIGLAAYNTASNILFITLALLLGCLVLSGVLSWLNFRGLRWELTVQAPLRAGREHAIGVTMENRKTLLPSYCVTLDVRNSSQPADRRINLGDRIDPRGTLETSWTITPQKRGVEVVELAYIGSAFPFGFLYKRMPADAAAEALVWPAAIEYRRLPVRVWERHHAGEALARVGNAGDLQALRRYQSGDSHRQIHWKVSARLRKLVVRQHTAEGEEAFLVWLNTGDGLWRNSAQFELLCSFAGTVAEDLFRASRLEAVAIDRESPRAVRSVRDVEAFLDRIALLEPSDRPSSFAPHARLRGPNIMTFVPEGSRGVAAYVDGEKAAAA